MKKVNAHEAAWQAVVSNVYEKIEELRVALERDANEITTAGLRGQLRAYRAVLTWPENGHSDEPTQGIDFK